LLIDDAIVMVTTWAWLQLVTTPDTTSL
jgi:hypothetical protein